MQLHTSTSTALNLRGTYFLIHQFFFSDSFSYFSDLTNCYTLPVQWKPCISKHGLILNISEKLKEEMEEMFLDVLYYWIS